MTASDTPEPRSASEIIHSIWRTRALAAEAALTAARARIEQLEGAVREVAAELGKPSYYAPTESCRRRLLAALAQPPAVSSPEAESGPPTRDETRREGRWEWYRDTVRKCTVCKYCDPECECDEPDNPGWRRNRRLHGKYGGTDSSEGQPARYSKNAKPLSDAECPKDRSVEDDDSNALDGEGQPTPEQPPGGYLVQAGKMDLGDDQPSVTVYYATADIGGDGDVLGELAYDDRADAVAACFAHRARVSACEARARETAERRLATESMRLDKCAEAAMGMSAAGLLPEHDSAARGAVLALRGRWETAERERDELKARVEREMKLRILAENRQATSEQTLMTRRDQLAAAERRAEERDAKAQECCSEARSLRVRLDDATRRAEVAEAQLDASERVVCLARAQAFKDVLQELERYDTPVIRKVREWADRQRSLAEGRGDANGKAETP